MIGTPTFSARSEAALETCHLDLRRLFARVIQIQDCTIIEGHRDQGTQDEMVRTGKSKVNWPDGKHNTTPSMAVDVAPYFSGIEIPWEDQRAFDHFAGLVKGIAAEMGMRIRWGGDWNGNGRPGDVSNFHDLPHFELMENER